MDHKTLKCMTISALSAIMEGVPEFGSTSCQQEWSIKGDVDQSGVEHACRMMTLYLVHMGIPVDQVGDESTCIPYVDGTPLVSMGGDKVSINFGNEKAVAALSNWVTICNKGTGTVMQTTYKAFNDAKDSPFVPFAECPTTESGVKMSYALGVRHHAHTVYGHRPKEYAVALYGSALGRQFTPRSLHSFVAAKAHQSDSMDIGNAFALPDEEFSSEKRGKVGAQCRNYRLSVGHFPIALWEKVHALWTRDSCAVPVYSAMAITLAKESGLASYLECKRSNNQRKFRRTVLKSMGLAPWWELTAPYIKEIDIGMIEALSCQPSDWVEMGAGESMGVGAGGPSIGAGAGTALPSLDENVHAKGAFFL